MKNKKVCLLLLSLLVGFLFGCAGPSQVQPTPVDLSQVKLSVTAVLKESQTAAAVRITPTSPAAQLPTLPSQPSSTPAPAMPVLSVTQTSEPGGNSQSPSETPEALVRTKGKVVAPFLNKPPVLDGMWDEWTTQAYPVTNIVYGKDNISDRNDLGGSFRIGWDDTYLYLVEKVGDDSYVQRDTLADIYKGDSLEIMLDTELQADFKSSQLNNDDYDLRISPGNPDPGKHMEAYLWFPRNISASLPKVRIAALGGSDTYRLETAIPWSVFGITPQPGMHFGFALRINDDDDVDLDLQQSAVSNVPGADLSDPTTWGDLLLTK
jgi:hypothetical protein